jgi:hypothetical protein
LVDWIRGYGLRLSGWTELVAEQMKLLLNSMELNEGREWCIDELEMIG